MNIALLGYIAYFFITVFNPLQLFAMVRGKNLNLGAWPLVSLVVGLSLLCVSFWFAASGAVPLYVVIGTLVSLIGCAANLLLVLHKKRPPSFADLTKTQTQAYEKSALKMQTPRFAFERAAARDGGRAIDPTENTYAPAPQQLTRDDFATCKECSCLVFREDAHKVEVAVRDVAGVIGGHPFRNFEDSLGTVRNDYYCEFNKLPYDRQVFYPGVAEGEATTVEYFKYVPSKLAALTGPPSKVLRQCDENGDPFD